MSWKDKLNSQYGGTIEAEIKTGNWKDRLNAQYKETVKEKKKSFVPIQKPAPYKQAPILSGETVFKQGKKPVFSPVEYNAGTEQLEPATLDFQGKGGFLGKMAEKAFNVPSEAITFFTNRVSDLFSFEPVAKGEVVEKPKMDTPKERVAGGIKAATSAIGLIPAWLGFSTGLEVAKETPVLKYPAKALSYGFEKLGQLGGYLGGKAVDVAPISEESKQIFREPIQELSAIASQVGGMKAGGKAIGKISETMKKKAAERQKKGVEITPEVSAKIVNETVKEIPLPEKEGVVNIPTKEGEVKLHTNKKLVLQNFIKGNEDINYKQVKTLGKDINGNPIQARFEWDYKKQEATILTTNKTTASNLAHELGHYYDRKLSIDVNQKLSNILPDYFKNKEQIDASLASYVLSKGELSAKDISVKTKDFVDAYNKELSLLSDRGTWGEKFADGVREFITNPEQTKLKAPVFSDFIEYNLKDTGLLAARIKKAVETTKKTATTPELAPKQPQGEAIAPKVGEVKVDPLIQEAKKYKSAEEFVKAQGTPVYHGTSLENANKINTEGFKPSGGKGVSGQSSSDFVYATGNKAGANRYVSDRMGIKNPTVVEGGFNGKTLEINGKMADFEAFGEASKKLGVPLEVGSQGKLTMLNIPAIKKAMQEQGYGAISFSDRYANGSKAFAILPDQIKTKSQLTDIWNKAQEVKKVPKEKIVEKIIEKPTEGKFAGTGLKTGETVKDRLAYNPDKINAPEDVDTLIRGVSEKSGEFKEQRISKTDENLKALAQEVDISVDDLMRVQPGSIANAETVLKSRQILSDLAQDLRDTIRQTTTETASVKELGVIKEKLFKLQGVMKTISGLRTEASNVFRSFKLETVAGENDILTELTSQLKKLDAKAGDDLSAFLKGSKELLEPTVADKAWHLWYMSILSGESTQIKNAFGNFTQLVGELVATVARNPKEVPTALSGMFEGLKTGFEKGKKILKEGEISKFEERGQKPIIFTGKLSFLNYMDYVGRFMSATDSLFREGFRGMEAKGKAREIAKKEGYSGEELNKRIESLKDDLLKTDEEVNYFGKRGTYTQDPEGALGLIAGGISRITAKVPFSRLIVPFTRIVANVTNNSLDWTPIGLKRALVKPITINGKTYLKEGGVFGNYYKEALTPRQRSQALARGVLGTIAMAYFATLAAQDNLSGNGPKDYKKRQQLKDAGWRENSVKIGDTWYPYQNWGPASIPMTLVGNYFDANKYNNISEDDLLSRTALAAFGSFSSIIDMSFLSGIGDLFAAVSQPEQAMSYLKNFVAQQATSPVPNLFKQTAKYFDPTVYEAKTVKEKIYSNLRITAGLKPKLNVFGQPIKGELLSQLQPVKETRDPLISYLANEGIYLTVPSKTTKIIVNGEKRGMTDDEYYEYVKKSGQEIYKQLTERLEYIKSLDADRREKYIDSEVSSIRSQIKYTFYK